MSARVVATGRPRSRAFAVLWAGAGLVRSLAASLLPGCAPAGRVASRSCSFAASATGRRAPMPWLVWADTGTHRCVGCGRCVEVCPSDALVLHRSGGRRDVASVQRFELDPGRCIGCGLCVESCPERALGLAEGAERVGEGGRARRRSIVDLLRAEA